MATQPDKPKKPVSKRRLVLSAGAGVALGILCRLMPEPWQIPCTLAVKLAAAFFGVPN